MEGSYPEQVPPALFTFCGTTVPSELTDAEKKFEDLQAKTERNTVILAGQLSEVSQGLSAQKRNPLMALRKHLPPEKTKKTHCKPPARLG